MKECLRYVFVCVALLAIPPVAGAQERPVGPTATVTVETAGAVELEVAPEPIPIDGVGTLTIRVAGLGESRSRRILRVVNATPEVIALEGGDDQNLEIQPSDVGPGGEFVAMLGVRGVGDGVWRIRVMGPATAPGSAAPPVVQPPVPLPGDPPPGDPSPGDPPPGDPGEPGQPVLDPPATERARLAVARGRWAEAGPANYAVTVERVCFCPPEWRGPVRVSVRGGTVFERTYLDDLRAVPDDRTDLFPGIEGIFGFIDEALDENPARIDVEYDLVNGRPIRVWVDYDERMADEERGFTTSDLTPGP